MAHVGRLVLVVLVVPRYRLGVVVVRRLGVEGVGGGGQDEVVPTAAEVLAGVHPVF